MSTLLATFVLTLIRACPSYETCPADPGFSFLPVTGTNPDTAGWNKLFEAASKNELASGSPPFPNIEVGPNRVPEAPRIACQILKPIAAAESTWQQFCPDTNKTVISFDCGFGVMQVTSGAASYGSMLASDTMWNVGAGTQILINKWNGEFRGGSIGDSDPMILENWYYAVWAYNGFVYGNNPDNPQFPPNRSPFHGPNSLARGSYPYQELVWGYLHYPLDWKTLPRWKAVPVTYPSPGQVGMNPRPLPKLEPEHRSECKSPCEDEYCDFELIVDDTDAGFSFSGSATVSAFGGYKDQYHYTSSQAPITQAFWSVSVPKTAIYHVAMYVPMADQVSSMMAPVSLMARGATLTVSFNQARPGGFFYELGEAKLVKDQAYELVVTNQSGEENEIIALDAVRIVFDRILGIATESEMCITAAECVSDLVCVNSVCRPGCEVTGCSNAICNVITGLCDSAVIQADAGLLDSALSVDRNDGTDDASISRSRSPTDLREDACSCRGTQASDPAMTCLWILILALSWIRRGRLRPYHRRYTS